MMIMAVKKRQNGSFLLITMISILIMLFSGLFVMEMAIMEEKKSGNEQRAMEVYQVAHSELEAQVKYLEKNPINFYNALSSDQDLTSTLYPSGCGPTSKFCQTVKLRYVSEAPPPPGYSTGKYISLVYEIDSMAQNVSTGASSSQTLGVIYISPVPGG